MEEWRVLVASVIRQAKLDLEAVQRSLLGKPRFPFRAYGESRVARRKADKALIERTLEVVDWFDNPKSSFPVLVAAMGLCPEECREHIRQRTRYDELRELAMSRLKLYLRESA